MVSWSISAELQGGTMIVRLFPCLGTTTVRTPGAISAMAVGSGGGGFMVLEPPHAPNPSASAPTQARVPLLINRPSP